MAPTAWMVSIGGTPFVDGGRVKHAECQDGKIGTGWGRERGNGALGERGGGLGGVRLALQRGLELRL